jgi:hypothetical protein
MPRTEDDRGILVAVYQQADFVVGREVHRTNHSIALALPQPSLGSIRQRTCCLAVVLALEPTEQAPLVCWKLLKL